MILYTSTETFRLAVHFKLIFDMIFAVQYKYLNCTAYKVIDAGHTAITACTY